MKAKNVDVPLAVVLDAGGQYVDMVKKAIERRGVRAVVLPLNTPIAEIEQVASVIIMSGSPASSHAEAAPQPDPGLWQTKLPFLGICYGQQALVQANGGKVKTGAIREDGRVTTTVDTAHPLFYGVKEQMTALFTHGDFVTKLPKGFKAIGSHQLMDGSTVYSAIAKGNFTGVQFHPEVFDDTPAGYEILANFLQKIAHIEPNPELIERRIEQLERHLKNEIKTKAGKRHVIAFASGGIDSTVATLLAADVIAAKKLHIFFIDNGFMRDEDAEVIAMLQENGINVQAIDAVQEFEEATVTVNGKPSDPLHKVTDPQIKRKIIGQKFVEVRDRLVMELGLNTDDTMLLQGTNAADRIESGFSKGDSNTDQIKEHHNQVKGIKDLEAKGLLIEPLDELFKDEIRYLGEHLGLPEDVVWRHPFPGPGLAIRILGLKADEYDLFTSADQQAVQKFVDASRVGHKTRLVSSLLPIRSVGVGGDSRSHISAVALQGDIDWADLAVLTKSLPQRFNKQVNRVVYALGDQSLANIQVTPTDLSREARNQLRLADRIVFELMRDFGLLKTIRQCPVVLLPLSFRTPGERSIVLRPVTTSTFMTVQAMLPPNDLPEAFLTAASQRILTQVPGISQIFLDTTPKPPGTTEWE